MQLFGKDVAIWDGTFQHDVTRQYRISLCTTCMGRRNDLEQTLPKNIDDNKDYPNLEFVILDYNSQDDLGAWVQDRLGDELESGRVVYYRTTEPEYYSMTHSRNIAFRLATGEIVNNVDADNWTSAGFATYLNRLANECPRQAIFAKGKRLMHGRLGFFKDEWFKLGGYDEGIEGYGHDDKDLLYRAWMMDYVLMWFGGAYCERIKTPRKLKTALMKNQNRKEMEETNKARSNENLERGVYVANEDRPWGCATVVKNFREEIVLGPLT